MVINYIIVNTFKLSYIIFNDIWWWDWEGGHETESENTETDATKVNEEDEINVPMALSVFRDGKNATNCGYCPRYLLPISIQFLFFYSNNNVIFLIF